MSLLGTGTNALIGMIVFALLFRALSKKEIGVYLIFTLILNLIDTLKAGLLTGAYINFISGTDKKTADEVAGSCWGLAALITGALLAINAFTWFVANHISNDAIALSLKYFGIVSLSTLPTFMSNLAVQSSRRFDRLLYVNATSQFIYMICIICLMFTHQANISHIIFAYIGSNAATSIIMIFLGWTRFATIKHATKKCMSDIFNFGKYSFGASISTNLFRVTDTFFLQFYLGPSAVAIYNLGGKLNQVVEMPMLSLAISGSPLMASHYNNSEPEKMIYLLKKMIGILTIPLIALAILALIFAEPAIAILGGNKYIHTEAPNVFRILMCLAVLAPTDRFLALTLDAAHKPQINFYKILVMLVVNLIADYVGITLFKSVYAIAFADICFYLVAIAISFVALNRFYKFRLRDSYVVGYLELKWMFMRTWQSLKLKNSNIN